MRKRKRESALSLSCSRASLAHPVYPAQVAVAAVNAAVSMRKLEAPELEKTYIVMDEGERAGAVGRLSP